MTYVSMRHWLVFVVVSVVLFTSVVSLAMMLEGPVGQGPGSLAIVSDERPVDRGIKLCQEWKDKRGVHDFLWARRQYDELGLAQQEIEALLARVNAGERSSELVAAFDQLLGTDYRWMMPGRRVAALVGSAYVASLQIDRAWRVANYRLQKIIWEQGLWADRLRMSCCKALDLPLESRWQKIKEAYRQASLLFHPDKCRLEGIGNFVGLSEAERKTFCDCWFKVLSEVGEVLRLNIPGMGVDIEEGWVDLGWNRGAGR